MKIDWETLVRCSPYFLVVASFAWLAFLPYTFLAHDNGWSWSKASAISLGGAGLCFLFSYVSPYLAGGLVFLLLLLSVVVWVARSSSRRDENKKTEPPLSP